MENLDGVQVAQITLTLTAMADGDLVLGVEVPPDDTTPLITRLGMLTMAQTMVHEIN